MSIFTRCRSRIDDRHLIRNPIGPGIQDMDIWANTLVKTRIASLFLTQEGLRGHAIQFKMNCNDLKISTLSRLIKPYLF